MPDVKLGEHDLFELRRKIGMVFQESALFDSLTVEENVVSGGFGSAVHEALTEMGLGEHRMIRFAVPDRFVTHGSRNELLEEVGLSPARIAGRVLDLLGEKA